MTRVIWKGLSLTIQNNNHGGKWEKMIIIAWSVSTKLLAEY